MEPASKLFDSKLTGESSVMADYSVSVVVPVYNEEDNVRPCYDELKGVLAAMKVPYEIIYVDDGSRDGTLKRLKSLLDDECVKVIELRRNFGQTAAMAAGFAASSGDIVVAIDGDLQNDPREIPMMIEVMYDRDLDLVAGWRKNRADKLLSRRLPSILANRLISKITSVRLHDYGCTLKVMRGEIARGIKLYGEMHRFIPVLAYEMGAKIMEVPVNHRPRIYGQSKYGISRTVRVVLDLLTVKFLLRFSTRPLHMFGTIGLGSAFVGGFGLAAVTFDRFVNSVPMGSRPVTILSVMLILIGFQFLLFGLLGEMLARTYYESSNREIFRVRNIFNSAGRSDD